MPCSWGRGLGCPLLLYLAAAGIGKITIIDDDIVSLSNLHRQILFSESDIGKSKADIAASRLMRIHPDCEVTAFQKRLDTDIARDYVKNADIVIDGTDSFLSKYILSDVTSDYNVPFLIGAVTGFSGYIAAFDQKTSYRDIFPVPPLSAPTCNETGILGAMAGQIACMMALETLKIIVGMGATMVNKMQRVDAVSLRQNIMDFSSYVAQNKNKLHSIKFISQDDLKTGDYNLIDLREKSELEEIPLLSNAYHVPLSLLQDDFSKIEIHKKPVFICHSGRRAERIALSYALKEQEFFEEILILQGGMLAVNTLSKK